MRFEDFDLFPAGELFLQRQRGGGGTARILDLPVDFLYFAFEAQLEVVGPAVEFFGLGLEEPGVTLGDGALDRGPPLLGGDLGRAGGDAQAGAGDFSRQGEQARGAFFVEWRAVVAECAEDQIILGLVERFDGVARERKPAGFPHQRFQDADDAVVVTVVEADFLDGEFAPLGLAEDGFGEGMI